ncbi:CHAT domain-containing protein [Streptomyces sp. NPDC051662]|uniref:CHAT domain-containing protein n=1 Tax=Streptomyces sp. NPDC051662 TaxID=3154750 RepID=UPI00342F92E5
MHEHQERERITGELERRLRRLRVWKRPGLIKRTDTLELIACLRRLVFLPAQGEPVFRKGEIAALARSHWYRYQQGCGDEHERVEALTYFLMLHADAPDAIPASARPEVDLAAKFLGSIPLAVQLRSVQAREYRRSLTHIDPDSRHGAGEGVDKLSAARLRQALEGAGIAREDWGPFVSERVLELTRRHDSTGGPSRLTEAIHLAEAGLTVTQSGNEGHAVLLYTSAGVLLSRHSLTRDPADLDQAMHRFRAAAEAFDSGSVLCCGALAGLSSVLRRRAELTYSSDDLTEAIRVARVAVDEAPPGSSDRGVWHTSLANALGARHERHGDREDLTEAIEHFRLALATPPSRQHAVVQANLAGALLLLHIATKETEPLAEAVGFAKAAVEATPRHDIELPSRLSTLGRIYRQRHLHDREIETLDRAIECQRRALAEVDGVDARRPEFINTLLVSLRHRYQTSRSMPDLEESISLGRALLDSIRSTHPSRPEVAANLANSLLTWTAETGSADLAQETDALLDEAADTAGARPFLRLIASMNLGTLRRKAGATQRALESYEKAIELQRETAWLGLDLSDRQRFLTEVSGLATAAAATALSLDRTEHAVLLLEQGRGILLAQATEVRHGTSSDLARADPQLAARVEQVAAELASPKASADYRHALAREWEDLRSQILRLPDLNLAWNTPQYDKLRAAAADGPIVVVNTDSNRCDAIVVVPDGPPVHIPLPSLEWGELRRRAEAFEAAGISLVELRDDTRLQSELDTLLPWLWDVIAEPVLDTLGMDGTGYHQTLPRLWWCPTGLLSLLPLHAAGRYDDEGGAGPERTAVPYRVISSYTPTVRALAVSRSGNVHTPATARNRVLAVAVPEIPGEPQSALPGALLELENVTAQCHATELKGSDATRGRLLSMLPEHGWLHFAGHGKQNLADPSLSALSCYDGPVTVSDLASCYASSPDLAFLSACETARGVALLPDEPLHLAGAMQLAGFRHVIAAQWAVRDIVSPDLTRTVYQRLTLKPGRLDATHAAEALHTAVAKLRRESPDRPTVWATYLHVGP